MKYGTVTYCMVSFLLEFEMMKIIGNNCSICGYSDLRALQIDLKEGGITKEYEKYGLNLLHHYLENPVLAKQKLELICANCKRIKTFEKKHTPFLN